MAKEMDTEGVVFWNVLSVMAMLSFQLKCPVKLVEYSYIINSKTLEQIQSDTFFLSFWYSVFSYLKN